MQEAGTQTEVLKYICLMPRFICKFISSAILSHTDVFSRWLTARTQTIFKVQLNGGSYLAILKNRNSKDRPTKTLLCCSLQYCDI